MRSLSCFQSFQFRLMSLPSETVAAKFLFIHKLYAMLSLLVDPAFYGSDSFGPDGRYTFKIRGNRHSIEIRSVQPVDDGEYWCTMVPQSSDGFTLRKSYITLAVLGE